MENGQLKDFLLSQIDREIKELYKSHLNVIAALNQEHLAALHKIEGKVTGDIFRDMNYFDLAKMGNLRKYTLDKGNDTTRNIKQMMDKIEVKFKE